MADRQLSACSRAKCWSLASWQWEIEAWQNDSLQASVLLIHHTTNAVEEVLRFWSGEAPAPKAGQCSRGGTAFLPTFNGDKVRGNRFLAALRCCWKHFYKTYTNLSVVGLRRILCCFMLQDIIKTVAANTKAFLTSSFQRYSYRIYPNKGATHTPLTRTLETDQIHSYTCIILRAVGDGQLQALPWLKLITSGTF